MVEAVTAALRASDDTYIMHGKAPAIAACAIAAVRAYDAAHVAVPVAVPAGGRDLATVIAEISNAWRISCDDDSPTLASHIAAELTRLGWTCAGPGAGAGQGVPGPLQQIGALADALPACTEAEQAGVEAASRAYWAKQKTTVLIPAKVAPACGISEGARETLLSALNFAQLAFIAAGHTQMADRARAELDALPVLGAGK